MNKFEKFCALVLSGREYPPQALAEVYVIARLMSIAHSAGALPYLLPVDASVYSEVKAQVAKIDFHASEKLLMHSLGAPFDEC